MSLDDHFVRLNTKQIDVAHEQGSTKIIVTLECGSPMAAAVTMDDLCEAAKTGTLILHISADMEIT